MIESGADTNKKNEFGCTALHLAAIFGNGVLLEMLMEKIDDVDQLDKFGNSALHLAVGNGNYKLVKIFVKKKANLNLKNESNLVQCILLQEVEIWK